MTTPSIYRITTTNPTPSPGTGQFLGYQIVNGSLVPNPSGGIFAESLGNVLSGASDYLDKGLKPTIPSVLLQGLGVITKADDYTKVVTNLLAGKQWGSDSN